MEYIGICANERRGVLSDPAVNPPHSHESYELFLPLAGPCRFEVMDYVYAAERGTVLALSPTESHRLVTVAEPIDYLYIQFTPTILPDDPVLKRDVEALFHGDGGGARSMWRLSPESFAFVYAAARRLCLGGSHGVQEQFFRVLSPLLHEILLYGKPVVGEERGSPLSKKNLPAHTVTDQIVDYVALHYADIRDLSFVGEVFHYSTVHVNSLFKARLGVSLWRYVLHVRLDRACDLLINGARAEEVATLCGFRDYSTFYRMFKKCYGITPTACRKGERKPSQLI